MPNDSLEKKHIISVLNWSIQELFKDDIESIIFLDISEFEDNTRIKSCLIPFFK